MLKEKEISIRYQKDEDKIWKSLEDKQIENFDRIEELNRINFRSKIQHEKDMRDKMMNERLTQMQIQREKEEVNDKLYIEQSNLALEREQKRISDLKAQEKEKLLQI